MRAGCRCRRIGGIRVRRRCARGVSWRRGRCLGRVGWGRTAGVVIWSGRATISGRRRGGRRRRGRGRSSGSVGSGSGMAERRQMYSDADDELIRSGVRRGLTLREIAGELGRTYNSVHGRMCWLRRQGLLGPRVQRADLSLCPKCELAARAVSESGKVRAYCNGCEAENSAAYGASAAGRAASKRYRDKRRRLREENQGRE